MLKVKEKGAGYGAIGPKNGAKLYGLKVLEENIEDTKSQTRFVVISKSDKNFFKHPKVKTSIIFAVKDAPGALYEVLKEFAERKINLTKIESRPSRRKLGEYIFFTDFEGNLADAPIKEALDVIKERTTFLKILGSY